MCARDWAWSGVGDGGDDDGGSGGRGGCFARFPTADEWTNLRIGDQLIRLMNSSDLGFFPPQKMN